MRVPDDERPTVALRVGSGAASDEGTTETRTIEDHLVPGADVGGYVVDGELGIGGMGIVYSATHPLIGKRAAIKVLRPELSHEPGAVERFVLEARAVNQIGHPNIVDIFAFGALPDGRSYYVMDLLTGESLRARLRRGPLHVSEAASVIDETASALIAAHAKGIIHRDLKPDNVFMVSVPGRWPEVKILDWGLVKLHSTHGTNQVRTLTGEVMGTPVYMSPEQSRGSETLDYRTDIYALGVMSYELLAGVVPFKKRSSIDTMLAHQEDPIPPLRAKVPTVPEELAQLIEAMLAKNPDDRPTLAAVRAVIKRLRSSVIPTMTAAGLAMVPQPTVPPPNAGVPSMSPMTVQHDNASMAMTVPRVQQPPPVVKMFEPSATGADLRPQASGLGPQTSDAGPPRTITGAPGASFPPTPMQSYPRASHPSLPPQRSRRWIMITAVAVIVSGIGIALVLAF